MLKQVYAYTITNPTEFQTVGDIFGTLLPNIFTIAGLLLFLYLIFGGFKYLTSAGDEDALEQAKKIITSAVIGMLIIFASYWIMWIIQTVFGIPIGVGPDVESSLPPHTP